MSGVNRIQGRAWLFGDKINTDVLAPGLYMKLPPAEMAAHCLESANPDFAKSVQPGDILVAGEGFGIGSSREHAARSLKLLGVGAVIAKSFARIFWRNAINVGLPAVVLREANVASAGDSLELDVSAGKLRNLSTKTDYFVTPLPDHLLDLVAAGGLVAYLKQKRGERT